MKKTLLGIFTNRADVEEAIDKLKANGLDAKEFSIVMQDKRVANNIGDDTGVDVAGSAFAGATTGAAIGGITGFLAGTVLPGLSGLFVGGPIGAALGLSGAAATTVTGATTGALAGGLIGALMGMGLSEEDAQKYESHIREGAILLIVPTTERKLAFVQNVFNEYNASDVKTIDESSDTGARTSTRRSSDRQHYKSSAHEYTHQYATVGAKGGKSSSRSGRGWHGDPKGHAKAAKGKKVN